MLTALRTRDSCVGNPIGGLSVWPLVANGCLALGNVSSSQQQLGPPVTAPDLRCQGPWPARRGSSLVFFQNPGLVVRSDSGSSQSAAFCSLGPPSSFRVPPPPPAFAISTTYTLGLLCSSPHPPQPLSCASVATVTVKNGLYLWVEPRPCLLQVQSVSHLAKGPPLWRMDLP